MKNLLFLSGLLILSAAFILSCEDTQTSSDIPETVPIPGELDVHFTQNVTVPEASAFLTDLSLRPIDLSNLESRIEPNWTIVGVPEGEEKYWIKQLIHYPHINHARQRTKKLN